MAAAAALSVGLAAIVAMRGGLSASGPVRVLELAAIVVVGAGVLLVTMWFAPLASGDFGIKALTQMQCSAAVATGAIDFVIGHPIAWMPCPFAQVVCVTDGINTAFSMARIFDDACLAFLDVMKPSSTAVTYTGTFTTVRG